MRFEGKFGFAARLLSGVRPNNTFVEVQSADLELRCGWGLSARIPRSTIARAEVVPWPGRWKIGWQLAPENRVYAVGAKVPCALLHFEPPQPIPLDGRPPFAGHRNVVAVDDRHSHADRGRAERQQLPEGPALLGALERLGDRRGRELEIAGLRRGDFRNRRQEPLGDVAGQEPPGDPLEAGEELRLEFATDVVVSGDDAGVVRVTLNGHDAQVLGASGAPLNIRIPRQGYESWLRRH